MTYWRLPVLDFLEDVLKQTHPHILLINTVKSIDEILKIV